MAKAFGNPLQKADAALRFVVEFSQMNLNDLSPSEALNLQLNVHRFLTRTRRHPSNSKMHMPSHPGTGKPIPLADLRAIQANALTLLMALVHNSEAAVEVRLTLRLADVGRMIPPELSKIFGMDRTPVIAITDGTPNDRFQLHLTQLLEQVGANKIKRCTAERPRSTGVPCGRLFVKVTRKEYCSATCQIRVYQRAARRNDRPLARNRRIRRGKTRAR